MQPDAPLSYIPYEITFFFQANISHVELFYGDWKHEKQESKNEELNRAKH